MAVRSPPLLWVLRVLWATLPFSLGELLTAAVDEHPGPVRVAVAVLAWGVWGVGIGASFVALPAALTVWRVLAPVPAVAGLVAATQTAPGTAGWVGLGTAAVVAVLAMSAEVGGWFVDGASYGDERRVPLRPPAVLLAGPVQLVWALTVAPIAAGVVMLAARWWAAGAALAAVGVPLAWWGGRTLHRLARRALVFVPAGMTLVDDLAVAEPVLFARRSVTRFGPAPAGGEALDLSAGAAGLILRVDLDPPVAVVPNPGRGRTAAAVTAPAVLIAPSRPGATLCLAEQRRIRVGRH